jgi:hypothetical protein
VSYSSNSLEAAMSALGQNQTYVVRIAMSAFPPKADMCGVTGDVRMHRCKNQGGPRP